MKRKTRLLIIGIVLFAGLIPTLRAQQIGLKTNLLYWGTTTPNAGLEFRMGKKWTLDVSGGYNPFNSATIANSSIGSWLRSFAIGRAKLSPATSSGFTASEVSTM